MLTGLDLDGDGLSRSLNVTEVPAAEHAWPDREEQHHDEAATQAHRDRPQHDLPPGRDVRQHRQARRQDRE